MNQLKFLPYFYSNPQFRFTGVFNGLKTIIARSQNTWPIIIDASSDFHMTAIQASVSTSPDEGPPGTIAYNRFQIADGTTRQLMDNPTLAKFFTWVQAPSWKIMRTGSLNTTLYNDTGAPVTTINPFVFQGFREYDQNIREEPTYPYREEFYVIRVPISYTTVTVNPPGFPQKRFTQVVSNYNFKLRRIRGIVFNGPNSTLPGLTVVYPGFILYDYQLRALSNTFIPLNIFNYNHPSANNAASFPNLDLLYPVNSVIQVDVADLGGVAAGFTLDQAGELLYEGVNLIPCSADDPRRVQIPVPGSFQGGDK